MENQSELFFGLLGECLADNTFVKLVLGKYRGPEAGLSRVFVRRLTLKGQECLSFLYRYQTKDITKNLPIPAGIAAIRELCATSFNNAHLQTVTEEIQLPGTRRASAPCSGARRRCGVSPPRSMTARRSVFSISPDPF